MGGIHVPENQYAVDEQVGGGVHGGPSCPWTNKFSSFETHINKMHIILVALLL